MVRCRGSNAHALPFKSLPWCVAVLIGAISARATTSAKDLPASIQKPATETFLCSELSAATARPELPGLTCL
eukprot:13900989-Alexandrium_andersonii.AAC.1